MALLNFMETRITDGSLNPLSSLKSLICSVNHILQSNQALFSVVDKCDSRFYLLLKTLDYLSSEFPCLSAIFPVVQEHE